MYILVSLLLGPMPRLQDYNNNNNKAFIPRHVSNSHVVQRRRTGILGEFSDINDRLSLNRSIYTLWSPRNAF